MSSGSWVLNIYSIPGISIVVQMFACGWGIRAFYRDSRFKII